MLGSEADCLKGCIAIPSCITVVVGEVEGKCWFYEGDDVYVRPETIVNRTDHKIISLGR